MAATSWWTATLYGMAQRRRIRMGSYLLGRHRTGRRRGFKTVDLSRVNWGYSPEVEAELRAKLDSLPSATLTISGFYRV